MNFLRLSIIFLCFSITSLSAQTGPAGQSTPKEPCSHKQQALTLQPANKGQTTPTSKKVCDMTRTIPVVVHVVHMCGPENVSDLQIQNAITALDLTFNKLNNYGASIPTTDPHYNNIADIGINFKLAEIDPNGNATTGITRTESHLTYAGGVLEGQLKQLINWDRSKYLNIWVVASSGGSAYAQYPATVDQPPYIEYDGIVSTHTYFGATGTASGNPYPEILTHEVGHWLNLIHTWGDQYFVNDPQACNDDDMVADTPNTVGNYTVGCTNLNPDSCADPGVDNEHNFMDYACEVMFTNGQKARMWDCLCSPIAQRDTIGTAGSNVFTFLPNPTTPRFTTSGYFFKESPLNNGTIQSSIDITLSSGSFVPTLINGTHYTFSPALPSGLSLSVTNTGGNVVTLSITGNAANHSNSNDVSNLTINFNSSAVTGVNHSSLYKSNISGLEIDFFDPGALVHESFSYTTGDPQCIAQVNGQWTSWLTKYLGYVGMVFNSPEYHMYNEGQNPLEVLCIQGGKNLANLPQGTQIDDSVQGYSWELVKGGASNDPDAIVLWSSSHLAFDNTLGYAGFRFKTFCGNTYNYGWMSFYSDPGAQSFCIVDMVFSDTPGVPASPPTGNCFGNGDSTFDWVDQVDMENITNQSGNNGGYIDYSNLTITVDPSVGADFTLYKGGAPSYSGHWKIWIDFNGNGSFNDPGERVYYYLQNGNTPDPTEMNYPLVPTTTAAGNYTMRVGISLYSDYDPCGQVQYGEFEDYSLQVTGSCVESELKVLLEGPLVQGTATMNADLFDLGLLPGMTPVNGSPTPSGQPYDVAPWNYSGTEGQNFMNADYQAIFNSTGQKPVDWILVSFRSGAVVTTEVERTAALLLQDGSIYFINSCLALDPNQGYYIVIQHRNHLDIMSPGLVNYVNGYFTNIFYTQDSYTTSQPGSKQLGNGIWAMYSSDLDGNGQINSADRSAVWNARNQFGYQAEDADLNGICDAADRSDTWNNKNNVTQLP